MYAYGGAYDTALPKNKDGSYGPISLGVQLPYFNYVFSTMYVNTNGLISFLEAYSTATLKSFPLTFPLIAPFWTDIDTLKGGQIYYRESSSSSDLTQAQIDISKVYFSTFNPTRLYITTWYLVAPYSGPILYNTFQTVIATDGILSFVIFNFQQMSWSYSTSNHFGYNAGDNINYYFITVKCKLPGKMGFPC